MECPKCKETVVVPAGTSRPVHECKKPKPKAKKKKESAE